MIADFDILLELAILFFTIATNGHLQAVVADSRSDFQSGRTKTIMRESELRIQRKPLCNI